MKSNIILLSMKSEENKRKKKKTFSYFFFVLFVLSRKEIKQEKSLIELFKNNKKVSSSFAFGFVLYEKSQFSCYNFNKFFKFEFFLYFITFFEDDSFLKKRRN